MTEQERLQAALAEYNQFVVMLQAHYGVNVLPCLTTDEYPGEEPKKMLTIKIKTFEGWQPPAPTIAVDNGASITPDEENYHD